MKPIELIEALQPLRGRIISVNTVDGHALQSIGAIRHLTLVERMDYKYDVLLEFAGESLRGIILPAARVRSVEISETVCIVRYGRHEEKRIFILGEQLALARDGKYTEVCNG